MTEQEVEQFMAAVKEASKHIDPETAEVFWEYGQIADPYWINPNLPPELKCTGRLYFARSPDSDIWVCFRDLPKEIRSALWEKHWRQLAFPAGLPLAPEQAAGDEKQ